MKTQKKNNKPTKIRLKRKRKPSELDVEKAKNYYGGKFPKIKGKKYKYPKPENEKGWICLITNALNYQDKKKIMLQKRMEPINNPKFEYVLYHCRPDKIKDRAQRNKDRKIHLEKGDDRVVHHYNQKNLKKSKTVILTHCEHQKMHGKKCKKSKIKK
tara:strand:- start:4259 stop:4729 length:471 start_codon:yes stop_codon:yes gene_type:complete